MQNIAHNVPCDVPTHPIEVHMGSETKKKSFFVAPRLRRVSGSKAYLFAKRLFDIVAALFFMVLLAIPMVAIAVCIKLDSPGTVLYRQKRLGKDGKEFDVLKFRSMHMDAEESGAQWASLEDPRTTRIGGCLRKCRLDELPQLYCILVGDMSFVGPRPERPVFYKEFAKYIDGFEQRLAVVPGLTGLAQVRGGYELDPEEKIVYDVEYIENRSAWLDLKILFETVAVVFNHDGAR